MEYTPMVNMLLEVLAYFGRRAAGNTAQRLMDRLRSNGVTELRDFWQRLAPIGRLMDRLDEAVPVEAETLQGLFGNLPGFPYNTIGSYSPVFLLLYPLVCRFEGDLDPLEGALANILPEELAGMLALSLDVSDEMQNPQPMSGDEFSARVLDLSVPAESKVAILDLYHRPQGILERAMPILRQALSHLNRERAVLEEICAPFTGEIRKMGPAHFISQTSGLSGKADSAYVLRPFLFGLDTNLAAAPQNMGQSTQVYCGILRGPIQAMLNDTRGPEYEVYNAIKLLGDKTRFDILCYLRGRKAYGQELSGKFGLSRNTIHHHMSKLLAARLVSCTVDGNRVYYTVDQDSVSNLLDRQRELLIEDD